MNYRVCYFADYRLWTVLVESDDMNSIFNELTSIEYLMKSNHSIKILMPDSCGIQFSIDGQYDFNRLIASVNDERVSRGLELINRYG